MVNSSNSDASITLLTAATDPNGLTAATARPAVPAGSTPAKT
jgi:hypothetical protein